MDLTAQELTSLMTSVQEIGRVVEKAYNGDALTIACQDGKAAGQTVPHVHFHLLPRKLHGDRFSGRNDDVYPAIERAEAELPHITGQSGDLATVQRAYESLKVDADENRKPRTMEEMEKEAHWLKGFFASQSDP
jgi:bis(5'-adenosyl)-triphosphatase